MNFELTDEQRQIQDTFARFCDDKIAPQAAALDEAHAFPHALFKELGALGFFAMRYPAEVGGLDTDLVTLCLALEEIARGSMSLAGCVTMQSLMGTKFLELLGNDDIRNRLLIPALRGEKIGAICMTEPNAGSDLGSIATAAVKTEGGYRLKGQKMWVTSAPVADFFTVFARAGNERKLTIFLLEKDFPGLHVGKAIAKMGVWALPTSELALDDCFVPDSHRLSREEGDGETHLRKLLAEIRIVTGALALGGASGALEEAIRYARERQQFGKPINRYQAIQLKLAEMGTELEAARRLVHYAAWLKDNDKPHHKEAAMAKLFASEAAVQICDKAARVMASYGYSMEYAVQRHLRDIRFTLIGGGTSEILKLIIAKELSGVTERKIKVLLAKPGLDGHDVGAKVVVQALLDAGFEVTYTGLRQTPEAIAKAAKATNADVVGLSILSGTHLPLCRRVCDLLLDHGLHDKLWIVGGNIPENDRMVLRQLGYRGVFPTGSRTEEIVTFIRENVK